MKKSTVYECSQCGNRFLVKKSGEGYLAPLYCCGAEVRKKRTKAKSASSKKKSKKKKTPKA